MTTAELSAVDIERASEQIRQERETFDQQKNHAERWFRLRLAMGYSSILLLGSVIGVCGYLLLNPADYSPAVLTAAASALFVDVLGLLAGVWKISLSPELAGTLAPVTRILSSELAAIETGRQAEDPTIGPNDT